MISNSLRNDVFEYTKKTFGTKPEYLWSKTPDAAVLRHSENNKWYALIMSISKRKLGIDSDDIVSILNVKSDVLLIKSYLKNSGYYPAYHMNKNNWITILLDGTVDMKEIISLINLSYELTLK